MSSAFVDRRFQLWEYRVSHGSLLIRSPRGPGVEQNIDLVFSGVEYVACPRMLRGLELQTATPCDVERARDAIGGDVVAERVFVLVSGGRRNIVVAAGCRVTEHAGDIFDSPFA